MITILFISYLCITYLAGAFFLLDFWRAKLTSVLLFLISPISVPVMFALFMLGPHW